MIPHHIIYVTPENMEARARIVRRLMDGKYDPMVAVNVPKLVQLEGLVGIVFDQNLSGSLPSEFRGLPSAIVWYNVDIAEKDLRNLIPFFEAQLKGLEYEIPREDRLLLEFTRANRDTEMNLDPEEKKIKV